MRYLPQPFSLIIQYLSTRLGWFPRFLKGRSKAHFSQSIVGPFSSKKTYPKKKWWNGFFIRQNLISSICYIFSHGNSELHHISQANQSTFEGSTKFPLKFHPSRAPTRQGRPIIPWVPLVLFPWNFSRVYKYCFHLHGWGSSSNKNQSFYPMVDPDFYSSSTNFPFGDPKKTHLISLGNVYIINPHLCWWNQPNSEKLRKKRSTSKLLGPGWSTCVYVCVCVCSLQLADEATFTYPHPHVKSDNFQPWSTKAQ